MKQALLRLNDYDCFIIDEADICLIEQGGEIDPRTEVYIGFWDMMEKKTILLSATAGEDFEDI